MAINANPNILVIIGQWPSKTHPYLVWLFGLLRKEFGNLQLMLFEEPALSYGYELLGKEQTQQVLEHALYRQPFTYNPFTHIKTIITGLLHLKQTQAIIKECKQDGLTNAQVYGQFLYFHCLLGKKYDLVHINALQTAYHFKAKAWFGNAKVLVSSRGQDFDFFPDKYDTLLTKVDHVHVLGSYLKNKVLAKGIAEKNITIIPPAHIPNEPAAIQSKKRPSATIHIATAARLTWTKGYRYAIEAIAQLIHQNVDVHYHIYGDGDQKEELLYLVNLLNIRQHVTFHGWLTENVLKEELVQHDIYLLLSIEEGFNNSVVLAQSLGLPCIVANTGGLPENTIHLKTGLVVETYNSSDVVKAIMMLNNDPALYEQMSLQAIQKVNQYTIPQQIKAYATMYHFMTDNN